MRTKLRSKTEKKRPISKEKFLGRPDRACSSDYLREAITLIYCHNGNFVATDGHILVKIPIRVSSLSDGLSNEMTQKAREVLEGRLIHPAQYRELLRYNLLKFENPGEIRALKINGTTTFETIFRFSTGKEMELTYPNYEALTTFEGAEINEIGINQNVLNRLFSCFESLPGVGNWKFSFQAKNRAIHLSSQSEENEGVLGLIMPVMLNDYNL